MPSTLPPAMEKPAAIPISCSTKVACVRSLGIGRPFELTVHTTVRGLLRDRFVHGLLAP
jgi:hypothetical protein